ncbi:MAG: Ig-like domain-containing protein [Kofleriaceae bacterium]
MTTTRSIRAALLVSFVACTPVSSSDVVDAAAGDDAGGDDAGPDAPPPDAPIDRTPPDTVIVTAPPTIAAAAVAGFAFASDDPQAGFRCSLDGAPPVPCPANLQTPALADGAHALAVAAIDLAGNVDPTPAEHAWSIDTGAPVVTVTGGPGDASVIANPSPSYAFTVDEAATTTCAVDAGAEVACTSPFTPAPLAEGTHAIRFVARDAAGNQGEAVRTVTVDRTAPIITITSQPASPTNANTAIVAFTSDESALFTCRLDAFVPAACGTGLAGGRTMSGLADGDHALVVTATDGVGNARAATVTWTLDRTAPQLTLVGTPPFLYAGSIGFAFGASEAVVFSCTVTDDVTSAVLDGPRACGAGTSGSIAYGTALPSGTVMRLTVDGIDAAGNRDPSPLVRQFCRGSVSACATPL